MAKNILILENAVLADSKFKLNKYTVELSRGIYHQVMLIDNSVSKEVVGRYTSFVVIYRAKREMKIHTILFIISFLQ